MRWDKNFSCSLPLSWLYIVSYISMRSSYGWLPVSPQMVMALSAVRLVVLLSAASRVRCDVSVLGFVLGLVAAVGAFFPLPE